MSALAGPSPDPGARHLPLCCLGIGSSLGAPCRGSEAAPRVLLELGLAEQLRNRQAASPPPLLLQPAGNTPADLARLLQSVADTTAQQLHAGRPLLILGGDHTQAAATWRGIGRALGEPPGLLWIDAHLDAHTPATSPSGNAHGMPVAALLDEAVPGLSDIPGPPIDPARLVMLGARSWEAAEAARLARHGVNWLAEARIRESGWSSAIDRACRRLGNRPWGLSLDIDVLDPRDASGVSTPVPGGPDPTTLAQALRGLLYRPGCVAIEIVEFNPARDPDGRTGRAVLTLLDALLAP